MKTIIAGCRHFTVEVSARHVRDAVAAAGWHELITEVVSGTQRGVDVAGEQHAKIHGLPVKQFPPDWDTHGRTAGPIRNRAMAEYADALVAVWDGKSPGTRNMITEATKRGLKVYVHRVDTRPPRKDFAEGFVE